MSPGVGRRFVGSRPAYHQTRAGDDPAAMGLDDASIHPMALAEIIRIHDQIPGGNRRCTTPTIGDMCQHSSCPPLQPSFDHHLSQYLLSIEVFRGNFLGSLGMFLVVTVDRLNGGRNIL
jgi:hypothetical protein